MASHKETITRDIILNVKTRITEAEKSAEKIKRTLADINVSDSFKKSMTDSLAGVLKDMDKLKEKLNSTMTSSQMSKWEQQWGGISNKLNEIVNTVSSKKLSPKDLIFDENTQKRINDINASLKKIEATKARLDKKGGKLEAIRAGMSQDNQLKTEKSLGLNESQIKSMVNLIEKNLGNEQALNRIIAERAPGYEKIKKDQERINTLVQQQIAYEKMRDALNKPGKLTNAMKSEMLSSELINTTGLNSQSNKDQFRQAFNNTAVRDFTAEINRANAALERTQSSISGSQRQSYNDWARDLIRSTREVTRNLDEEGTHAEELNRELTDLQAQGMQRASRGMNDLERNAREAAPALDAVGDEARESARRLEELNAQDRFFRDIQGRIAQIFGLANAFVMLRQFMQASARTIKELDAAFTEIAVVTEKTSTQLWESFDEYNKMARELGATTKDAVKTSALYYQQGLSTADVMNLTTETIKMARIAGMDYSAATDAMTSAIRGFKMEMSDSQRVVDVYSALAAKSAVDTQQLATAISKVASIAQSAGMELETTSAFLSQIIETTQEAPETAGTALKTIIARFTEMNKNISSFKDENGEIVDVNKTEEALKTVGIMLRDEVTGQIRDVGSVFLELAAKWDSLDRNAQRYVATVASGARQQSRFIAMMDNYKRTQELIAVATNASGAATTQFNKTLDSVESKMNQLKASFETIVNKTLTNEAVRGFLDGLNNILTVLGNIASMGPMVFIPVIINLFNTVKGLTVNTIKIIKNVFETIPKEVDQATQATIANTSRHISDFITQVREHLKNARWDAIINVRTVQDGQNAGDINNPNINVNPTNANNTTTATSTIERRRHRNPVINFMANTAQALNKWSMLISLATTTITTGLMAFGEETAATGATVGNMVGSAAGLIWGPIGVALGGAIGTIVGGVWTTFQEIFIYHAENTKREIKKAKKVAEKAAQEQSEFDAANASMIESANIVKTLTDKVNKQLTLTAEETESLATAQDALGRTYPELVSGRDAETGLLTIATDKLSELIKARQAEAEILEAEAAAAQYNVDQKERARENIDTVQDFLKNSKTAGRMATEGGLEQFDIGTAPASLQKANKEIVKALKRADENTAKDVDAQVDKIKAEMASNSDSWGGYTEQVDGYLNKVYNAVSSIQTNLKEEQAQLMSLANFDANLLKYYKTTTVDGEEVSKLTKAMTKDLSAYLATGLAEAVKSGEVNLKAADEASDSLASWLQRQLHSDIGGAYKQLSELSDPQKAEYDTYSALIPYFKGAEGGMTKAFEQFGLDASDKTQKALIKTLRMASDSIPVSQLSEDAQKAIRAVATSGNLEQAVKLAESLSDFNINSSNLTTLKAIQTNLNDFANLTDVSSFIQVLTDKIKTMGYTAEEAAARMTGTTSKLAQLTKLEGMSGEGKLTSEDVANLIGEYSAKYGISEDNFNYDTATGGFSAVGIDWNTMRTDVATIAKNTDLDAIATNNAGIISKMEQVSGRKYGDNLEQAVADLKTLMGQESTANLKGEDFIKSRGMTKGQQTAYGDAKEYFKHNIISQKALSIDEQVLDLKGVENYESAMAAAVATSRKFAKAIEDQTASASNLSSEFKITDAQIEAIEKEYPQLKGRMDDINSSAERYFTIMNEVAELETAKDLEETGKSLGNYLTSIEGLAKNTSEFQSGIQSISEALSGGEKINGQFAVSAQFAAENLGLIRKACEDDFNAFSQLQRKLAEEIFIRAGSKVDFSALMKGLISVKSLSADVVNALTAAGMFEIETKTINIPDIVGDMTGFANSFMPGGTKAPQFKTKQIEVQFIKPSNKPMYQSSGFNKAYSTPKGSKGGGKSGGGGGDKYETKAELYYNEIKAIEALVDSLDDLGKAREKSQLNPVEYKKNLESTLKASKQLQDALHDYNNKLRKDKADVSKQINSVGKPGAAVVHNGKLLVNKQGLAGLDDKTQKKMDEFIDKWIDLDKKIKDNSDQYMEIADSLREIAKAYQESFISMEDKILGILIENDKKEIELTQKKYDKIKEADSDYLEALKKNINARRRERDKENNYKELAKKEKRLALLKRDTSGIYGAEILALEEELAKTRQDMSDNETDEMLSKLDEEAELRAKDYDKQMKELEELQKDKEEKMTEYNAKVNEIMQMGAEDQLKWLQTYDQEFLTATETARQQYIEGWQKTINEVNSFKGNTSNGTIVDSKTKAEQMAKDARAYLTNKSYGAGAQDISSYNAEGALNWYKQYIANGRTDLSADVVEAFKKIIRAKYMWEGKETPKFAKGGLVDFTGPAWVDGTKASPEAFLSAEETKNFKMLAQLLQRSFSYSGLGATESGNNGGVQVEQLTIEVQSIGSDYDVDRMIERVKQDIIGATGDRNINILNRRR